MTLPQEMRLLLSIFGFVSENEGKLMRAVDDNGRTYTVEKCSFPDDDGTPLYIFTFPDGNIALTESGVCAEVKDLRIV